MHALIRCRLTGDVVHFLVNLKSLSSICNKLGTYKYKIIIITMIKITFYNEQMARLLGLSNNMFLFGQYQGHGLVVHLATTHSQRYLCSMANMIINSIKCLVCDSQLLVMVLLTYCVIHNLFDIHSFDIWLRTCSS